MSQILADLDEIVFESRNQEYGAYVLRKSYQRTVTIAFVIAFVFSLIAVLSPLIAEKLKSRAEDVDTGPKTITYAELKEPPPIDKKEEVKPPDIEPPKPPKASQVKFVPPVVVEKEKAKPEETIANIDSLLNKNPGLEDVKGDDNAQPDFGDINATGNNSGPVEVKEPEKDPDPKEFIAVEKEPAPVNLDELKKSIGYPPNAKEAGIQGKVIVRILVGKDGGYEKHIIVRSPHNILTQAVESHLKNLKFTPGIQAGKPIKVWVTIPFDFKLL